MAEKSFKNANKISSTIKHKSLEQYKKDITRDNERKLKLDKFNAKADKTITYTLTHGTNIFILIIIILVSVTLIRFLYNGAGDIVSFGSLLDMLQDAPQVSSNVKNFVMQIGFTDEWVILDGFRIFLNSLINVMSIITWLFSALIDVAIFLVYFIAWVFI